MEIDITKFVLSLDPLKEHFNQKKTYDKMIVLVSPT